MSRRKPNSNHPKRFEHGFLCMLRFFHLNIKFLAGVLDPPVCGIKREMGSPNRLHDPHDAGFLGAARLEAPAKRLSACCGQYLRLRKQAMTTQQPSVDSACSAWRKQQTRIQIAQELSDTKSMDPGLSGDGRRCRLHPYKAQRPPAMSDFCRGHRRKSTIAFQSGIPEIQIVIDASYSQSTS